MGAWVEIGIALFAERLDGSRSPRGSVGCNLLKQWKIPVKIVRYGNAHLLEKEKVEDNIMRVKDKKLMRS